MDWMDNMDMCVGCYFRDYCTGDPDQCDENYARHEYEREMEVWYAEEIEKELGND